MDHLQPNPYPMLLTRQKRCATPITSPMSPNDLEHGIHKVTENKNLNLLPSKTLWILVLIVLCLLTTKLRMITWVWMSMIGI